MKKKFSFYSIRLKLLAVLIFVDTSSLLCRCIATFACLKNGGSRKLKISSKSKQTLCTCTISCFSKVKKPAIVVYKIFKTAVQINRPSVHVPFLLPLTPSSPSHPSPRPSDVCPSRSAALARRRRTCLWRAAPPAASLTGNTLAWYPPPCSLVPCRAPAAARH